ncbi:hypothetical protein QW060_25390 [Myroides ceti]|uniref:Uncharacterized protein n=1 Tax=Paenimyroides ceti TaxID=395087 RepID=A0ABT8D0S1_9FLAO|nr:hypothetical protein [Paenimyroides ceti]MDN3710207.1 hypothetical protein [Paenimyroides ceti]
MPPILFLFPLIANAQHLDSLSTNISSSVIAAYFEKIDKEDLFIWFLFKKKIYGAILIKEPYR